MPEDHSSDAMGDMLMSILAELEERVSYDQETQKLVRLTVALAANNARVIGANEMAAQLIQQGVDLQLNLKPGEQAPATLASALGDE